MTSKQFSLFSSTELYQLERSPRLDTPLEMSAETLLDWKDRIIQFQRQVTLSPALEQGQLFDAPSATHLDPNSLDPFALERQNTDFWRWTERDRGVAAFYFVIDYECDLLLYVGETITSTQRWKGEHDCKRYLMQYRQAHYQHDLSSTLGIAFYRNAPTGTRDRQTLESALIRKWRSPFNKENWTFWNTPFVGGKL
ncbi:MAG: GIY-YIG nuclease family protein [Synechococcales cyanobacterium T60_A2020_003]|nr:GIY-YIG nuclease family protein [Synechococcales cyanobacterium T60_A2020_003]